MISFEEMKLLARKEFRNIPEEMFLLWMDGLIKGNGWPPASPPWQATLRNKSLQYWKALSWREEIVDLKSFPLNKATKDIVSGLFKGFFENTPTPISNYMGAQSKMRLQNIETYIFENARLPGKLIFLKDGSRYDVVDGCHRLTCLIAAHSGKFNIKTVDLRVSSWIGEPDVPSTPHPRGAESAS
jgi:hypothetical protein